MITNSLQILCVALLFARILGAQTVPPEAPSPQAPSTETGAYDWWARAGLTCAVGASESSTAVRPTAQCGAVFGIPFFDLETGVMGPQAQRSSASGYASANFWIPLIAPSKLGNRRDLPLAVGGYARMFETGHAVDYGLALARPLDDSHSLQLEVRDYWELSNAHQHNVVFRAVWLVGLTD